MPESRSGYVYLIQCVSSHPYIKFILEGSPPWGFMVLFECRLTRLPFHHMSACLKYMQLDSLTSCTIILSTIKERWSDILNVRSGCDIMYYT